MSDVGVLRAAIDASGLSARRFAADVLLRDERTVRRWLAGDSPIPEPVMVKLRKWALANFIVPELQRRGLLE